MPIHIHQFLMPEKVLMQYFNLLKMDATLARLKHSSVTHLSGISRWHISQYKSMAHYKLCSSLLSPGEMGCPSIRYMHVVGIFFHTICVLVCCRQERWGCPSIRYIQVVGIFFPKNSRYKLYTCVIQNMHKYQVTIRIYSRACHYICMHECHRVINFITQNGSATEAIFHILFHRFAKRLLYYTFVVLM